MKNIPSIPIPTTWYSAESFGALFVVAMFVFLGVTLLLGWPAVHGAIASLF